MFKSNLSVNAKKRINILKNSNDGFEISEEDMKLRGFGDLLGFKQSGIKNFRLADPIQNEDLFLMAEKQIKKIELENTGEIKAKTNINLVNVFVPTTPNPTSGFLLMIPKNDLIYLDMTFEEASKFIVSAGTSKPKN